MIVWEYTLLCLFSLLVIFGLDKFLLKTNLALRPRFWLFIVVVVGLQTIVDNYLNGRWFFNQAIVGPYNPDFYSNLKVWHTPIENYLFGIALIYLNIVLFEFFISSKKPPINND